MSLRRLLLGEPRGVGNAGAESRHDSFVKLEANDEELFGPLTQPIVTSGTQALTMTDHQGATVYLTAPGTGISFDAAVQGNGFTFVIVNRTGSDWFVSGISNATLEFEDGGTKVASGKSAGFEVYTRGGTRYLRISGATVA